MTSLTEENYLKAIYVLNANEHLKASTNAIAERMQTKASSVSDMLKRLKEKQLINYQKYKTATLTEEGKRIAISIIRKHRLWEYFLVKKLHFGWDQVHDLAEQLEHIRSKELTNKLEEFLEFPKMDPHGDPIPDRDGKFPAKLNETLSDCSENITVTVIGVKDHSTEFLSHLNNLSIDLGSKILIKKINAFDQSQEITINQTQQTHISKDVAKNLYIEE